MDNSKRQLSQPDKKPLYRMFSQVPDKYDLLNRLITFGFDQIWRKKTAHICMSDNPVNVMDLCSGTGDLAIEFAKRSNNGTKVISADFCEPMLAVARNKATKLNMIDKIDFKVADAGDLPYPENKFDAIGIAFGFRNLTFKNPKRNQYLKEILRVLAPGGKLFVVETSQPKSALLRKVFHLYFSTVVAYVGGIISGRLGAYKYLAYSAVNYHNPAEIDDLLGSFGFADIEHYPLMGGVSAIYIAKKPEN
jgi:demethylmenaquinone methyltransferase/2-methoxy-6-polyprenyl-1,4-benzoquinol methylase